MLIPQVFLANKQWKMMLQVSNLRGFTVLHQESTFPIDLFLLMGDNYIGNDEVGRKCHTRRMNFEKAILQSDNNLFDIKKLYSFFSEIGIGREIFMIGRKNL